MILQVLLPISSVPDEAAVAAADHVDSSTVNDVTRPSEGSNSGSDLESENVMLTRLRPRPGPRQVPRPGCRYNVALGPMGQVRYIQSL